MTASRQRPARGTTQLPHRWLLNPATQRHAVASQLGAGSAGRLAARSGPGAQRRQLQHLTGVRAHWHGFGAPRLPNPPARQSQFLIQRSMRAPALIRTSTPAGGAHGRPASQSIFPPPLVECAARASGSTGYKQSDVLARLRTPRLSSPTATGRLSAWCPVNTRQRTGTWAHRRLAGRPSTYFAGPRRATSHSDTATAVSASDTTARTGTDHSHDRGDHHRIGTLTAAPGITDPGSTAQHDGTD